MTRVSPKRLHRAAELLATGRSSSEAVELLVSEFGISQRTAWRDIERVYARWAEEEQARRRILRLQRIKFLEHIARAALQNGAYSAAVAAVKQLCRIEGLEQVGIKLQHSLRAEVSTNERVQALTRQQRARSIKELMERRARSLGPAGIDGEIRWLEAIKAELLQ